MYGTMSMEVLKQRREELMREAELGRLKVAASSELRESRYPSAGLDRNVGAGEGRRTPSQVLRDAG